MTIIINENKPQENKTDAIKRPITAATLLLFTVIAIPLSGTISLADQYPSGSYKKTCKSIIAIGHILEHLAGSNPAGAIITAIRPAEATRAPEEI